MMATKDKTERCGDCAYASIGKITGDLRREIMCTRYPPGVNFLQAGVEVKCISSWPVVSQNMHCGEFCPIVTN